MSGVFDLFSTRHFLCCFPILIFDDVSFYYFSMTPLLFLSHSDDDANDCSATVSATVCVLQEVRSFLTAAFVQAASRKKEKE